MSKILPAQIEAAPLIASGALPEFWGEVQPPASLRGLDIPSRRAVFVLWKPSRRPAFGWETRLFRTNAVDGVALRVGIHPPFRNACKLSVAAFIGVAVS